MSVDDGRVYSAITFTDLLDGYPVSGPNQIEDSKHGFRAGQQIAESLLRGIESKSCDEIGVLKKIIQSVSSASFENLPGGFLKYLSRSEKHTEIITQMDRLGWLDHRREKCYHERVGVRRVCS